MKTILFGFTWKVSVAAFAGTHVPAPPTNHRIQVTFVQPERFTDFDRQNAVRSTGRAEALNDLGTAMQRSAAQYLRDDLRLTVRVTNLDQAGDYERWRGARFDDLRVVRDVYPPRMRLAYELRDARGRVLQRGDRKLSDPNFLFGNMPADSDRLRFEKALFHDWLRTEFPSFARR